MELLHSVWVWVIAVLEHWHGYIGGGVLGFCFELSIKISKKLREWQPSKKILASIFVGGLLFSCFAAWQEQYQEAIEAEKKLEELTKAHLDAEIVMNAADETPTEKPLVYVWMGISNRIGPPSGVWRWIMRLSLNDGRSFEGHRELVYENGPKKMSIIHSRFSLDTSRNNFLPVKTEEAIAPGSSVSGWFWESFPTLDNLDDAYKHNAIITVEFYDTASNQKHSCEYPLGREGVQEP